MNLRSLLVQTICFLLLAFRLSVAAPPILPQAQAIQTVRTILQKNAGSCKIKQVRSITAKKNGSVWRVTAQIVMAASGRPLTETAVWGVSEKNAATPMNQLTAEISKGCP